MFFRVPGGIKAGPEAEDQVLAKLRARAAARS